MPNNLEKLFPKVIENTVENLTDKPTKNIGDTLADIWYLVFGGISLATEKRKLKYAYALQEFEHELKEKISKIPENKIVEPDMQLIAPALESAKYCIEKEELRHMFANLICSSLSSDTQHMVHPIFSEIIKSISPLDAQILLDLKQHKLDLDNESMASSLHILSQFGLIYLFQSNNNTASIGSTNEKVTINYHCSVFSVDLKSISITSLGYDFLSTCT